MKRFLLRVLVFGVTCFVLLNAVAVLAKIVARKRVEDPGSEVYDAMRRSHKTWPEAKEIVVGDSVAHQLLTGRAPPQMLNLAANQAVTVAGQYFLARTALEHNPQVTRVTLAYQPACFVNNFDEKFEFNYFVKPFYPRAEYRREMSPLLVSMIDRQPVARFVVFPVLANTSLLGYIDYSQGAPKPPCKYVSPLSAEYLHRLAHLCADHHAELRIVSTPISRDRPYDQAAFFREVAANHLEPLFTGYAETVRTVDPALLVDQVHFKDEAIAPNWKIFVEMLRR
jgi:hypothetical protein